MLRSAFRTLASTWIVCILAPAAAPHDGAKFEPPDGYVLHGAGQRNTDCLYPSPSVACDPLGHPGRPADCLLTDGLDNGLLEYIEAIGADREPIHPLISRYYYDVYSRTTYLWHTETDATKKQCYMDAIKTEKLDELSDWLTNLPAGMMPEISISFGNAFGAQVWSIITSGDLDIELDRLAQRLLNSGRPMFIRIGFEPTEAAENEPLKYVSGEEFTSAYKYLVRKFRAKGIDAAYVLCAGPNAGKNPGTSLWDLVLEDPPDDLTLVPAWYPGDAWVDWLGVDLFTIDQLTDFREYPALLETVQFANARKKPVFLSEISANLANFCGMPDPICDCQSAAWNAWFVPFFGLFDQENHPEYKRIKAFNYIYWNWPEHGGYATWSNAQFDCDGNGTITPDYVDELDGEFVHLSTIGHERFDHPWWVDAGGEVSQSATTYELHGANGNSDGGAPPLAYYYVSEERYESCCSDPWICEELGIPLLQGNQTFFPKDAVMVGPLATNADGTFSIAVNGDVFAGESGMTLYVQALLLEQGQAIPRATNQFVLHVVD